MCPKNHISPPAESAIPELEPNQPQETSLNIQDVSVPRKTQDLVTSLVGQSTSSTKKRKASQIQKKYY